MTLFPLIDPAVAVKFAEVAPAGTLTEAGTVSAVLLLESETDSDNGAAAASVAVQTAVVELDIICVPDTVGRTHVSPESGTGRNAVMLASCETPL